MKSILNRVKAATTGGSAAPDPELQAQLDASLARNAKLEEKVQSLARKLERMRKREERRQRLQEAYAQE